MKRLARRLGLSCAALLAVALGFELYLRVFAPVGFLAPPEVEATTPATWNSTVHVPSTRPGLAYEVAPNLDVDARGMKIRTNALGLRGPELLPRETPQLRRVAVIGDSMTFGFGVQQGEDFPAQMQRVLAARGDGRRYEVLNFGVGGYSTLDEVATLREKALATKPDLVVIAYCLNDPEVGPLQPLQACFTPTAAWRYSHVARWIAGRLQGRRIAKYGGGNYWRALDNPAGPFWPEVAQALDEARDLCKASKVPVLFAILPMLVPPVAWSAYPYADIHAHLAAEAQARGFEVLDLSDALRGEAMLDVICAPDDCHFNAKGNALVAAALAARVR